ncbi:MAG TPA: hypothetical protein DIC64_03950, partial [Alphaproteobacteria bacterium]|nr:hypothetical protein [Alphaproteobacteria bacterium]
MCSIRKLIKTSALALCFFGFIPSSKALDSYCEALPDCGSLGYEENIECPQGTYITCPYNVSFKKCVNASCEELGYTLTNKTGWCKNIVYCPTDSLYTLCAVECSACPSGELNPTCDYGTSPSSIDDCGHQCYVCKNCNLDEVSGWQTASTECNFSQYVQQEIMPVCPQNAGGAKKYVCGSCPTGMVAPSKNSSSCMCNEVAGYYATCPAGASCKSISTAFGNCYKPEKGAAGEGGDQDADGCDESQGWVLGSSTDTHFIYDETSTFNIDGVALTCKRAVGCNAASDASTNKPSEISAYFATSNKTIGSVKCYWVTGCSETHASSCSEARTLTNAQTKGNFTCGDCVCNETSGYYLTEQEGYSFTMVDGCYKVEGNCVNPYTIDTSDNHFTYGVASVCTKVTGCRLATQGASATNNYDSSYFDVKEVTNGGQKCYYVEGCKSPKVEASSCPEGQKPVNAKTAYNGGITCGTCECDETKGYYQTCPAGAACENVGACVKTVRGNNGDSDGDGCKEADGYVSSTITDNHFNFGSIVSFKVGSSTITCKPVTGCNSAIAASTDQLSGIGAYFATTNKTLGTKTCHWVTGCQSPYADDCSESRTLNGSQTKGGYTCGTCICDTDNGYYDQCPSGQTCKTVDGCETATGCANNYTTNTTDSHFTYGPVLEGTTCREVTGCNSSKDGSTKTKSDINEAYFVINNNGQGKTVGNTTCYWVTGCKSPYKSDCSESRTLDGADTQTRGGYTCGTCICDTNNGWTSNPTGLGGSSIDGCYNTTTCADNYTTNTSDNHFTYGPVVEGTSCREVTGCDNTKAGSTTTKSDINATYFTINNNGQGKTVGMTACYWIIGCQPDYGDTCPTGQKLSGVPSAQGGFTCQSCECDEANGYYKNVPTGQTYEIVNGCYHLTGGCSNPYTSNTSDNHFTYGPADTCTEVTGCNSSQDGSTTQNTYNSTYFDVRSVPNGGWVCYYTNSCKSPYVSTCSATGQKLSNTQTAYSGGPTCGTCTCDTSAGYYSLGFCPESLVCTAVGECEDAEASCNASNGYYDSNTDEHFSFGDAVSKTVELGINKTCYKVTGCNTTKDYISGACPEGTYPYNEDKKGGFTCYKCGSCVPPAGSAASGECPTGYKSSTTVTGNCGGITYYACECDSNNGYYTQSQKEATTGVTFNTHANTGYPTCYTFASCAAGWSAGSAIDDGLVGNIFVSSSLTSITKTDKSSEACYQISGCESPYVNRVCTSSEEQFGQPYVAPNNSSVTCRECRTIPLCPIPQVCNYVTTSVSNGSVVYNFNTTSFNADISAYNTCMGDFTKTAGCSDIGASASASGSITAPNGEKCNPNESSCGASCNSSLASDATTTKPTPVAGYNFDSVSTSDGICYYNISPKTCAEQTSNAYPYETQQTCSSKQTSKSSPSMYYVGASQIYCWSDCQCNETLGYYASNPNTTGMIWSQDSSSGCYRATGCDWQNNWNSSASFYQDYDNTATYLDNGTKKTCYHFTGCKYPYRLQDMRPDYFEIDEIGAAAGETCYYEYECNVGYDIPSGANLANYDYATSAFGLKCGKLACDNVA